MKGYGSLFERLAGEADLRAGLSREACATRSVARHLAQMLGTRAGSVQIQADYGLPDLNDLRLSLHDALSQTRAAIERCITDFEPRLSGVRVVALPRDHDPLRLSFCIEGALQVPGVRCQVSWRASLEGGGRVRIEP